MINQAAHVAESAAGLVLTLDGTYGKTWQQILIDLDEKAADGEQVYIEPAALAGLIRALLAYGALPASVHS
jgi:hypothetical protein